MVSATEIRPASGDRGGQRVAQRRVAHAEATEVIYGLGEAAPVDCTVSKRGSKAKSKTGNAGSGHSKRRKMPGPMGLPASLTEMVIGRGGQAIICSV